MSLLPVEPEGEPMPAVRREKGAFGVRLGAALAGLAMVLGSFSLRGFLQVGGGGFYAELEQRELLFFFIHSFFLFPGCLLLAWGLVPARIRNVGWTGGPALPHLAKVVAAGMWVVFSILLAVLFRWYWLDDRPITAGEETLRFGARLWAAGERSVPAFDPAWGFSEASLWREAGRLGPEETPGALAFSALMERLGFGQLPAFLLASLTALALVFAAGPLAGPGGRRMAALLWTFSPMVLLLGISATGEFWARSFLALAWATWLVLPGQTGRRRFLLLLVLGATAAIPLSLRPGEAACLLLPVGVHLGLTALRPEKKSWDWLLPWGLAAVGLLILGVWRPAGAASPLAAAFPASLAEAGSTFAAGSAVLALRLGIFFLGPALLPLLFLALRRGGEVPAVAGSALLLVLLRPLLTGASPESAFGPIAGSSAAIPLLVLCLLGIAELRRQLATATAGLLAPRTLPALGLGVLLALAIFSGQHAASMIERTTVLAAFEPAGPAPAIVLVEDFPVLFAQRPELALWSVWRGELPLPDPFLRDRVHFARASRAEKARLQAAFPQHQLYRVRVREGPVPFLLERLE